MSSTATQQLPLLPRNVQDWKQKVTSHYQNRPAPSPHQVSWAGSSRIDERQFLALRCIWPRSDTNQRLDNTNQVRSVELLPAYQSASTWLDQFPPFQDFLQRIRTDTRSTPWNIGDTASAAYGLGIMEIPRRKQEMVLAASRSSLSTLDEEMVFSSLMTFLEAISIRHPDNRCDWSAQRTQITAPFRTKPLRVRVDGRLIHPVSHEIKALVETKKDSRGRVDPHVSWQETAEIVALLKTHDQNQGPPRSPFYLVVQDRTELFVVAAVFTPAYVNYIRNNGSNLQDRDFLQMRRFGPWRMGHADDVNQFAKIALAIALKGSR
ncbi:uncharacterized protein N7459_007619 [Penicillium hispanicum]|uniref:uncharacterized protein n=1 Tax=Penicillium hispanicum TaxID=1080232 RepID=UPI0025403389|nr:uncharacterized protein N7459_007619 [Penicillium hispanicum]KAJ5578655.1 hypothetical protein N7459_007619 [Penicillium hispanicum]